MRARPALALVLLLAACATEAPGPAAPTQPAYPPQPAGWRAIPALSTGGDIVSGYVQDTSLVTAGAVRRAWILINLRESIPIPETGGRAQSVRFLGEYRCAQRLWRPLEGAWFARLGAQDPVHAERPRGAGFRPAEPGTLGGTFLDAACGL